MEKEKNTEDILEELKYKYFNNDFRIIGNDVQQSKTVEIQGAHFVVDKPWIVREPNYDYAEKELEWYKSESLNVNDIPDGAPKMWKACTDPTGLINSNYGWCIWSKDNGYQYKHCLEMLLNDNHTREACMIYNRPQMQTDYNFNGMHDFMCTMSTHCFINEHKGNDDTLYLGYQVFMRSSDAVFGFPTDALWHHYVQEELRKDLESKLKKTVIAENIIWNAASIHVYERHFHLLDKK